MDFYEGFSRVSFADIIFLHGIMSFPGWVLGPKLLFGSFGLGRYLDS